MYSAIGAAASGRERIEMRRFAGIEQTDRISILLRAQAAHDCTPGSAVWAPRIAVTIAIRLRATLETM